MLATAGFANVSSMEGGIHAWEGLTATGEPEAGMAHFPDRAPAEELVALSWLLEEGSRKFYAELPNRLNDHEAADLFRKLVSAEEQHKSALAGLYTSFTNREMSAEFRDARDDVMEGGVRVSESLAWAAGKSVQDVLAFSISLETNSYDLYIKMGRRVKDARSKEVFSALSSGEKSHLERLAGLLDRKL